MIKLAQFTGTAYGWAWAFTITAGVLLVLLFLTVVYWLLFAPRRERR
jgi:hypothetical protein